MAIHLGYLRAGWLGLIIAGLCFIVPPMLMVLGLAWLYVRVGTTPQAGWLLYGIKPVVIAIIVQAIWNLGRKAIRGWQAALAIVLIVGLYFLGINELVLLFGGGFIVMVVMNFQRLRSRAMKAIILPVAGLGLFIQTLIPFSLPLMFLTFLKIGAVLYGSGYVLMAFLRSDLAEYPNIADEIGPGEDIDFMERWARLPVEAESSNSKGLVVVKKVWFRPSSYFAIKDDEFRDLLFKECPDGCEAHFVNGVFAKAENKNLDDCWTISFDPRSQHIHADPTGLKVLIPVQDVFNEVYNLTVQTIESGIPETFADPEVLDFDKYNKTEKAPGQIYPAKPRPGETVDKAFTTIKTATVSQEIEKLASKLEQLAQFLVGSFPSIYGGQMTGSRTAAEYSMSRQQALQRLSTLWTIVTQFWSELMSKTVVQYANGIQEDEKFVKPQGNGFVNVWIRKASLTGKVGHVEPDTSEQFPISWSQKRDILLDLLQLGIPEINAVLFHPENAQLVADLNGLGGLKIPGTNDRNKQYAEIDQLLVSQPMPNAEGAIQRSVPIDLELEDHAVHVQICKSFLSSERGQGIKVQNPAGYANVMSHLQAHQIAIQQLTMQPHEQSAAGEVPNTAALSTGV